MMELVVAVIVGTVSFVALDQGERWLHRRRHNKDTSYRWGVWLFTALITIYAFVTSLGR